MIESSSASSFGSISPEVLAALTPPPMPAPRRPMAAAAASADPESDLNIARAWQKHTTDTRFVANYGRVTHLFPRCDMNKYTTMRNMELCVNCNNRAVRIIREYEEEIFRANEEVLRCASEFSRRGGSSA